jgi:hypothetical protein
MRSLTLFALTVVLGCAAQHAHKGAPESPESSPAAPLAMRDLSRDTRDPGSLRVVSTASDPHAALSSTRVEKETQKSSELKGKALVDVPHDLAAQKTRIDACYEDALKKDARLAGTLELLLHVDHDGSVSHVRVGKDTVHNVGLRKCVARAVSELRTLPQDVAASEVSYPVVFGGSDSDVL